MTLLTIPIARLDGSPDTVGDLTSAKVALIVNVASRCGLTPQYAGLEELHRTYAGRGFTVVGVPCNQFMEQEPGTAEEIQTFCSATYGVTFPMTEKIEVNGPGRHALYEHLVQTPNAEGRAGDVEWNFEKFLVAPSGEVVARFGPRTEPNDPAVIAAVESMLTE